MKKGEFFERKERSSMLDKGAYSSPARGKSGRKPMKGESSENRRSRKKGEDRSKG